MALEDHREEEAEDSVVVRTVGANRKQDVQTGDSDAVRTVGANRKQDVQIGDSDAVRTVGANRKQDVQIGDRIRSSNEKIIITPVCILNHSCFVVVVFLFVCFRITDNTTYSDNICTKNY